MAGEFLIRAATAADQETIRALIAQARINPMGLHWPNFLLAQAADGSVIGAGQVKPHRDGSRELASIATLPGRQRGGVATALIRELIRREQGVLYLYCATRNKEFYPRFGFYEVSAPDLPPEIRRIVQVGQFLARLARSWGSQVGLHAMRRDPTS